MAGNHVANRTGSAAARARAPLSATRRRKSDEVGIRRPGSIWSRTISRGATAAKELSHAMCERMPFCRRVARAKWLAPRQQSASHPTETANDVLTFHGAVTSSPFGRKFSLLSSLFPLTTPQSRLTFPGRASLQNNSQAYLLYCNPRDPALISCCS